MTNTEVLVKEQQLQLKMLVSSWNGFKVQVKGSSNYSYLLEESWKAFCHFSFAGIPGGHI